MNLSKIDRIKSLNTLLPNKNTFHFIMLQFLTRPLFDGSLNFSACPRFHRAVDRQTLQSKRSCLLRRGAAGYAKPGHVLAHDIKIEESQVLTYTGSCIEDE